MLDDFFLRAFVGGIGVALVAGPTGCFIVWRRLAYLGDTLAHSALLGAALAILLSIDLSMGVLAVAILVALALLLLQRRIDVGSDTLLGLLSHSTLAIGLALLALTSGFRVDLMALLMGDILSVSKLDIAVIYLGGAAVLLLLASIWRPLLAGTVNMELARAEGLSAERANIVFLLVMAVVVAIAMKITGILLITALLIIPAATARGLASGPEQMALIAALAGCAGVAAGLFASLRFDTPSGPAIIVAAVLLFLLSQIRWRRLGPLLQGGGKDA